MPGLVKITGGSVYLKVRNRTQEVFQDEASNAGLTDAEGQNVSIDLRLTQC